MPDLETEVPQMKTPKVSIGLFNPKSPDNVSSVMRSCGNFGADAIFYTGTRYPRARDLNPDLPKMSRKVSIDIPVTGVNCLLDAVPEGAKVVCVELALNAMPLPDYVHPENVFYIFGPEDGTLSQEIIDKADDVIYVPTKGCLNLSASVNVLLYDRSIKSPTLTASNDLIRENRDTNNNIKVRVQR